MKPTLNSVYHIPPFHHHHHHHLHQHRNVTSGSPNIHSSSTLLSLWSSSSSSFANSGSHHHSIESERMSNQSNQTSPPTPTKRSTSSSLTSPSSKVTPLQSSSSSPLHPPQQPQHYPQQQTQAPSADYGLQQLISSLHQNPNHFLNFHHSHNNNQYLLEDFGGDDFDVSSLSSLCLGNNNNHQQQHHTSGTAVAGIGDAAPPSSSPPIILSLQNNADGSAATIMTKTTETSAASSTPSTATTTTATAAAVPAVPQQQQPQSSGNNQDHNNNINATMINQFFPLVGGNGSTSGVSLPDSIKVEDEYLLQFNMSGSVVDHHHAHQQQQQQSHHQHHHHHHQTSNNSPSLSPNNNSNNRNNHLQQQQLSSIDHQASVASPSQHHGTAGPGTTHEHRSSKQLDPSKIAVSQQQNASLMIRAPPTSQQHPASAPSPAMLMNHLDLSSIRSPSASSSSNKSPSSSSSAQIHHHHHGHHPGVAATTTASTAATITHLRGGAGFDPNELYYGDSNPDDSCQSLTNVDSSTIVHNTKSLVLQSTTVLMPGSSSVVASTPEEKLLNQVSKRIRFKGLIDQKQEEEQQQQNQLQPNLDAHNPPEQQLDLNAAMLEQNPFAYRPTAEALNENIYSSRNVANCYSYAWRRWSKTDAPSVKNRAGTVQVPHTMPRIDEDGRKFQYILGAPTSAGTRIGLMTMTYLNQGQSYEIRLKKLKKVAQEPNLKTTVRMGFVEKRLQYRENEELSNWIMSHNNGRMIDIDFSMSYGVFDVDLRSAYNHSIAFIWNPGREASIFVKINCISTEFTSKRHGGERGTPFRLIVDTYGVDGTKLDSACCLIKVFKSKGAERKHKTDRDRVAKHPDADSYYQPSYDCTLLTTYKESDEDQQQQHQNDSDHRDESSQTNRSTESPSESETSIPATPISPNVQLGDLNAAIASQPPQQNQENFSHPQQQQMVMKSESISSMTAALNCESSSSALVGPTSISSPSIAMIPQSSNHNEEMRTPSSSTLASSTLPFNSGAIETYEWLKRNRFFRLAEQLCDYTADDLRRLSRDDLIQLCDFKDGIRLYNLIHSPLVASTQLTIFITLDGNEHYALYFQHLTVEEFRLRISETLENMELGDVPVRIRNIHMAGPNGIRVKLTDNVIQNMKNESIYNCMLTRVDDEYDIVIRLIAAN